MDSDLASDRSLEVFYTLLCPIKSSLITIMKWFKLLNFCAQCSFLKAEAYTRLSNADKAKENYNKGVTLAFERWGKDASSFIADGGAYAFNSKDQQSMLTSILTQKWIAATRCQAWDSWFDINRTGIPALGTTFPDEEGYVWGNLTPCIGSALGAGEYPRRLLYPKGSSDYNTNTPPVIPLQEKQWWHK